MKMLELPPLSKAARIVIAVVLYLSGGYCWLSALVVGYLLVLLSNPLLNMATAGPVMNLAIILVTLYAMSILAYGLMGLGLFKLARAVFKERPMLWLWIIIVVVCGGAVLLCRSFLKLTLA